MTATDTHSDAYYDPYDLDLLANPYPAFTRLRAEAPLYYNERYDFYAVTRFADVEATLRDRSRFSSARGVLLEIIKADVDMPPGTLIHEDAPVHTAHRQMLSRVFTPKAMMAIEPQVRAICAQRLDELRDRDSFDYVKDFARYVPMRVFGSLLGLPLEDQVRVLEHVEEGMNAGPKDPEAYGGFTDGAFYAEFLDHRIANPGDDLISRLIVSEFTDEHGVHRTLTRAESLIYLTVIAAGGNHTTNRLLGWTAKLLAEHPDARRDLVSDPSLVPNAIEETLRYEPSSTQIARYVTEDVELYDQTVPAGSAMLCVVGSANRDEREFHDPESYDIHRDIGHVLTFGYGPHFCLGASLARLEGRVALEELLKRFSDWEIDLDNAVLGNSPGVRGYTSLPFHPV